MRHIETSYGRCQLHAMNFERLRRLLNAWAQARESVAAVGIVGSYARGSQRPDSDVDIILVTSDPGDLLSETSWVHHFGRLKSSELEDYGLVQSLRCLYMDGGEIEFGVAGREWCEPPIDTGTADVIRDGMLIVYDPDRLLHRAMELVAHRGNRHA